MTAPLPASSLPLSGHPQPALDRIAAFADTVGQLRQHGYAIVPPSAWLSWTGVAPGALDCLAAYWEALPPDLYLKDGGHYRFRRHGSAVFLADGADVQRVAHRPHYQPTTYNALHGGILRWFEPIAEPLWQEPAYAGLLSTLGCLFARVRAEPAWYIEAHQFRIDASREVGKPTPEGAHRDGVDFVALALVARRGIEGGATTLYDPSGRILLRTTLEEPWTLMLLDDTRVVHETTPVVGSSSVAHRDTLVLTYRSGGFMAPEQGPAPQL